MGRWLTVSLEAQGSEAVEVELEDDESLLLTNLQSQFAKAKGLRYRNEENGALRAVKCADNKLQAPEGGWGSRTYLVVEGEPEDTAATEAAAAVAESTAASALAEEEVRPVSSKRPYESSSRDDYPREDDRKRSRADQPCYRCGGTGHIAHMCTSPWDSKDNADAQECYLCKGRGHMKHQCPNNLPKGVCYKCGQYGHQGRECQQGRGGPMAGGAMAGGVQNGGVIGGDYGAAAAMTANFGYGYAYDPTMYAAMAQQYAAASGAGAGGYGTSTPGYSSGGYGGPPSGPSSGYGGRPPKLCYRCQQPGHNALACPQVQEHGVSLDSCFKCGLQGHRAKDCNTCLSCKQPGHIAAMCPMRS